MNLMGNKVIESLNNVNHQVPESFSGSNLALLKSRFFVEGDNQFNCYHFAIPRVDVRSFFIDNREMNLPKNTIIPTNPEQRLKLSSINMKNNNSNSIKFICMFIEPQRLHELSKEQFNKTDLLFKNNINSLNHHMLALISKFEAECRNKQFGYQFILDCLSIEIAVNLMRELESNMPGLYELPRYSVRKEINLAIDYLWENVNSEFSLDDISAIANLSPFYFARLFKDHTGKTPYEYYIDIKIFKAIEYFKAGKHSITEVCFFLGFSSHSHFSSIFKKKVGMTPSEFIKNLS